MNRSLCWRSRPFVGFLGKEARLDLAFDADGAVCRITRRLPATQKIPCPTARRARSLGTRRRAVPGKFCTSYKQADPWRTLGEATIRTLDCIETWLHFGSARAVGYSRTFQAVARDSLPSRSIRCRMRKAGDHIRQTCIGGSVPRPMPGRCGRWPPRPSSARQRNARSSTGLSPSCEAYGRC
jgi:hypothetical protein